MPRYTPAQIEPKWQAFWEKNRTFKTPEMPAGEKLYVLDMFPYPSGSGLHVGHPEGYTATDIVCRLARMQGKSVLHPMGFDAFGLPAEEHAIKTGEHPRKNTENNIAEFTRQLKMLGFSYDWDRVLATTDVEYFRWTQWIFLLLFDTWYDTSISKGRPIAELPIPAEVTAQGPDEVRKYQDDHRLAFQSDALVNWCPALGTVLANEEVIDGKSERGNHPVQRIPLRQWMLRITAYADRLETDLENVDWSEGIKKLQRDWIGRSTGAEVDFWIGETHLPFGDFNDIDELWNKYRDCVHHSDPRLTLLVDAFADLFSLKDTPCVLEGFKQWKKERRTCGFPRKSQSDVLRIYTTRPDTLFGATYMVIAPEHPYVERLTTDAQKEEVEKYRAWAAGRSDRERQELTKTKTGVFTGSYAINPVNGMPVPIWIADYVLISYGTGAIMAVPAHDERDFEFAQQFKLPIIPVVYPSNDSGLSKCEFADVLAGKACFTKLGWAWPHSGFSSDEFKKHVTLDLTKAGTGKEAVNYRLRDWLFSRQRFWGEPFPILHELDDAGNPTGFVRGVDPNTLPVDLPHLDDFKPHGRPEPPLAKAPDSWLYPVIDGKKYRRETNTMPQWAGSCWYYLRFIDPRNGTAFVDREKEKAWMPVDLYVGGAEHAVLHLLYSRFWHKVLYDRGYVTTAEPFQKLVNQGMILGEMEYQISAEDYEERRAILNGRGILILPITNENGETSYLLKEADTQGVQIPLQQLPYDGDEEDQSISKYVQDDIKDVQSRISDPQTRMIAAVFDRLNANPLLIQKLSPLPPVKNLAEDKVERRRGRVYLAGTDLEISGKCEKMSKSRGNVVNPDTVVKDYGADSLRLYEMFMGPLEATKPWSMAGVSGVRNFLDRVWRLIVDDRAEELVLNASVKDVAPTEEQNRTLHKTIKQVTSDLTKMEFNTCIARMMEFTNFFTKQSVRPKSVLEKFVLLLSPLAPHIAEELWQLLGNKSTLAYEPWPKFEEALTQDAAIEIPVQVLGKLRGKITVPAGSDQATILAAAHADPKVAEWLAGKEITKTIFVPGKLVNFLVK